MIIDQQTFQFLGAKRVSGEGVRRPALLLPNGGRQSGIPIMGGRRGRLPVLTTVKVDEVRHPLWSDVWPKFLLSQEAIAATRQADDAHVGLAGVAVEIGLKSRPFRVPDATRDNVDVMPHTAQGQCNLLDVYELPAKIRVRRPVTVLWIKVALDVQESDVHFRKPKGSDSIENYIDRIDQCVQPRKPVPAQNGEIIC